MIGIMNKLDRSANMDTDMLNVLTKGTKNYVLGKYTEEQTIKYITKQLEIKLSE